MSSQVCKADPEHVIAGKAVAFGEALQPSYKTYCQQVIKNAQAMAVHLWNAATISSAEAPTTT